jgi:glycerol-3-phosphate dehydrogenase
VARRLDRDRPELFEPALAFNLLLDRPPLGEGALAVTPDRPDAPALFLQPLRGRLFAGTWYAPWTGPLDDPKVPDAALVAALADLAPFVPGGPLRAGEILDVFPGLLPVEKAGTTDLRSRDIVLDHGADGGPRGLFSVSGVKLTTAPTVAAKVVDALGRR